MIYGDGVSANLEFALLADSCVCMASFFGRSLSAVKSISASLAKSKVTFYGSRACKPDWMFQSFIQPLALGKDKFFHCIAVSDALGSDLFLTTRERLEDDFYNYLMRNFNYPILREWSAAIFDEAFRRRHIRNVFLKFIRGEHCHWDRKVQTDGGEVDLGKVAIYKVLLDEQELKEILSELLRKKEICISSKEQRPLNFQNMDEYFSAYGKSLVANLERQMEPLVPLEGSCRHLALKSIRLMPPQAAQVNGLVEVLGRSRYAILNMGMGTGKTITSISAVEGFFNKKKGSGLKEIYSDPGAIKYRNVVMCPGHLVEKWAKEIRQQVPYAKVTILNSLSQLIGIKKGGAARTKRDWYIIGKDFAKLGYQSAPLPKRSGYRPAYARKCTVCGTVSFDFRGRPFVCASCKGTEFRLSQISSVPEEGMVCPFCNHLLMENRNCVDVEEEPPKPLTGMAFTAQNSRNARCHICGESLWQPHVANLSLPDRKKRVSPWYQVTHYSNKTHKAKKTVWMHEEYADSYFQGIQEEPLGEKRSQGIRKYPPASYVKKHLKGFFDFLILDEAHLYKGGFTAQGNAMHAFAKSSSKVLALTGTVAGGMASDLFYLLYRLDPARMQSYGYKFRDEMKFIEKYGALESVYEVEAAGGDYNKISRGRQIQSPRPKPGISPLIFSDFLLDKGVFLDLSDMSDMLPPYREIVETVEVPERILDENGVETENLEYTAHNCYLRILQSLREKIKKSLGRSIMAVMLQFALSYLDKPYGVPDMVNPFDGTVLEEVPDFRELVTDGRLLAKERRLVEIVRRELAEGRNCVVYAEYTGDPALCVTHRLKEILASQTSLSPNEIAILEASNPPAREREAWMHKKAEGGVRIFITNPKCVETGLDFIWEKDGKIYNFPTLIFYQLGYSLFTVWQASRRAYRLVQKEECRTYYLAYARTLQEMAIQLIAEKQAATAAIQGKFSAGGISAMANGVDARVRLAQAMCGMDLGRRDLQAMFDAAAKDGAADGYHGVSQMPLVEEIIGSDEELLYEEDTADGKAGDTVQQDYFSLLYNLDGMLGMFQKQEPEEKPAEDLGTVEGFMMQAAQVLTSLEEPGQVSSKLGRTDKKAKKMGQVSLFGFY